MNKSEAKRKLKTVDNLFDFQEQFFSENSDGDMTPDFEVVYLKDGEYTDNPSAKVYDYKGSCTNSYMKVEDGYLPYPF